MRYTSYRIEFCSLFLLAVCWAVQAGCSGQDPDAREESGGNFMESGITVSSEVFADGKAIPKQFTGEGEDISPPLSWEGIPDQAKQLALICDDPDAPTELPWVHWVIYGIPASTAGLPENVPNDERLESPASAMQGKNSWSEGTVIGYRGPMPPPDHGVHQYNFKLYALDEALQLEPGLTKTELLEAIEGHIIASGKLTGTYER